MQLESLPRISVVIPTLNEQAEVRRALESSRRPGVERIVVDGGSEDGTADAVRFLRAERVLRSLPERGLQMQTGLRAARADVVLFLDAETELQEGWDDAVLEALADPRVVGGAFRLAYANRRGAFRVFEWSARLVGRVFGWVGHAQALFARRKVLEQIGGVAPAPACADLDLAHAVRAHGRFVLLPLRATAATARREAAGPWRCWGIDLVVTMAYALDFDRERLARWLARRSAKP